MPIRTACDPESWVVDIIDATDPAQCGGKATGLARLARAGCAVPAALCLTTELYRYWHERSGLASWLDERLTAAREPSRRDEVLAMLRRDVAAAPLAHELEAALHAGADRLDGDGVELLLVRSSGVHEDGADLSHAGIHASVVIPAHDREALVAAVKTCWASLWTPAAWSYRERRGVAHEDAAMAVVVQRFLPATCSGVAFSADPVTGDRATAVIAACWGTAGALVGGTMTPDEYRVCLRDGAPVAIRRRAGQQTTMIVWHGGQESVVPLDDARRARPVLTEADVQELVRLVRIAERATGHPVDIEWLSDGATVWLVQARPITSVAASPPPPQRPVTLWTRANLKEVFPELPSPLALSYLTLSLNRMFRAYHAAQGYALPVAADLVAVFRGRPYLNLSLMQALTMERGGDPAIVARMFGGADPLHAGPVPPAPRARARVRAQGVIGELVATFFRTPARGRRLFRRLRREAATLSAVPLATLDTPGVSAHLARLSATLLHETTLQRLHEVVSAQSRAYMVLEALLRAWIPGDADTLLKRVMTGLGTLPNARMVHQLMDLASLATGDARARAFFTGALDDAAMRGYERALAGTAVLDGLRGFLREFGHRGPYESDVMSPRFAEDPAPVLRMIQLHVRAGAMVTAAQQRAELRRVRLDAMAEVRRALRRARGPLAFAARCAVFALLCDVLQQLVAQRDECRHVTTMLVAHIRAVALEIGRRASGARILDDAADVFLLTWDELPRILREPDGPWRELAAERRRRREEDARAEAPNIVDGTGADATGAAVSAGSDELIGYGVSPGRVVGRVRVLRAVEGVGRLHGEIVVFPAIEPTLTPLFPLVAGIVTEMGGLLSHASILAREYGLPAVVSVRDATRQLRDGDLIDLDGTTGRIRVLERARSGATVGGRLEAEPAQERAPVP
jgi:pyruvate,water dikinase